jgi:hypothetical protein
VSALVAWASDSSGTYLATAEGQPGGRDGVQRKSLDFRDVPGVDARTAYMLASGPGEKSRMYKTADSGAHWTLQFMNPDSQEFLAAFAFGMYGTASCSNTSRWGVRQSDNDR